MSRDDFYKAYLKDAFYWVNKDNYITIQKVMQEFSINCHTGDGIIEWHDGFKNLLTFPPDKSHNFEYYQKTDCWHPNSRYGEPKNYQQMINDYNKLTDE